jgi:glycosyltransferase involved in cell wall biosynthesis
MGLELPQGMGDIKLDVIIATLTHSGEIKAQTQKCIDRMIRRLHREGLNLGIDRQCGALIPLSRNRAAEKAVDAESKHLLFVDSDMVFEDDALLRLLKHDRDIISGLCCMRAPPYTPVVKRRLLDGNYRVVEGLEKGRFYSDIDGVGAAFLLIKTKVFEALYQPYFATAPINLVQDYHELLDQVRVLKKSYCDTGITAKNRADEILRLHDNKPKNRSMTGEDYYFCERAKEAGFDICVDASVVIGHIGEQAYTITDYMDYKECRKQVEQKKDMGALNAA